MPLGTALGVITTGGRLFLTLRYRHAQFDARAARQFLGGYVRVLQGSETAH
jgi:hypothetical protein